MSRRWPYFIFMTAITVGWMSTEQWAGAIVSGVIAIYQGIRIEEELERAGK